MRRPTSLVLLALALAAAWPETGKWQPAMIIIRETHGQIFQHAIMGWGGGKGHGVKCPLTREYLKVIQYQFQKTDNTFITSDGTSPYNSTRKGTVKRHYREDNN